MQTQETSHRERSQEVHLFLCAPFWRNDLPPPQKSGADRYGVAAPAPALPGKARVPRRPQPCFAPLPCSKYLLLFTPSSRGDDGTLGKKTKVARFLGCLRQTQAVLVLSWEAGPPQRFPHCPT